MFYYFILESCKKPTTSSNCFNTFCFQLLCFSDKIIYQIVAYCIYNHRTTKTNQKYPSVNL